MIAEGRTPVPADRKEAAPADSHSYDPYVPPHLRTKFLRLALADFNPQNADYLRSKFYDEIIELKWAKTAKSQADSDYQERLIRSRRKP